MRLRQLGLVVHSGRPDAVRAAAAVRDWCLRSTVRCHDLEVWGEDVAVPPAGGLDLVLTLGGDGTFLRGARVALAAGAPVLGVDFGSVGFLTEVGGDRVLEALDAVAQGQGDVERRMTLALRTNRPLAVPQDIEVLLRMGRGPAPRSRPRPAEDGAADWGVASDAAAVNDVVFEKLVRDRQIAVAVYVAGRLLASYAADAAIVATATGSTAYSFAAGGPVLSPRVTGLVFTPVAAHMAFDRSIVAGPDEPVAIRVLPHSGPVAVSVDGQVVGVAEPGDWAGVYPSRLTLEILRLQPADFYGRLRERFSLADAPAAVAHGSAPRLFPAPTATFPDDLEGMQVPLPAPPARPC